MPRVGTILGIVSKNPMPRLVLTRKINEKIVLHDEATGVIAKIKISKIDRNQVRLTFEANSEIRIDREEIFEETAPTN
jgi:carbon storage regulator CsrA